MYTKNLPIESIWISWLYLPKSTMDSRPVFIRFNGIFGTLEDFSSLAMFVYLETLAVFPPKESSIDDRSRKASNLFKFPTLWQKRFGSGLHLGVSENRGTPKSSILIGFSIIKHPFRGIPIFGNTHLKIFLVGGWVPNPWMKNMHQTNWVHFPRDPGWTLKKYIWVATS